MKSIKDIHNRSFVLAMKEKMVYTNSPNEQNISNNFL